ncbi:nucleotidyltransferase family protein [Halalkalirubrum salinum]|uniref:nucleotidyltransferase family protein n=1 Tax=Halalkalirubrum salinum TaxID=2563889 RepID=UPI0010FB968C|nr:nucleotidyltransferase family protein [Halalkalirubrum salinum]
MTDEDRSELPIVDPPRHEAVTNGLRVAGLLLAAGTSSRFGDRNKLVTDVDGRPIVRHVAETLLAADLDGVTVVVGHEADRVRTALAGLDVTIVENDRYADGQATSVARGIKAIAATDADAVVIALGDMPFVRPETIQTLVAAYADDAGDALAPAVDGQRGNPVLFDRSHFSALRDVDGDIGGRAILLGGDNSALVAVADPGIRRDVDRPEDVDDRSNDSGV